MNNPDTNIFKIDRENDIEKFSRYGEKGISSINNISKSKIPSRLGRDKVVAGNYRLSNTPKQFIKNTKQQFNKYSQKRPNKHNFPKLDNLIIDRPQYRRYFSYPYYYDYYYDSYYMNQNLDNLPVINSVNYYVPYEYIPAERYYKGEIRTKYAGEKDENDITEAKEFEDNNYDASNIDVKNNNKIENFKVECKSDNFPLIIVVCIVVVIIFIAQSK